MRRLVWFILVMAACLAGGCAPTAPWWIGGDPSSPLVSSVALTRMSEALALSDGQRAAAWNLHLAYVTDHQRAAAKYGDFCRMADDILERNKGDEETKARRDDGTVRFARHADRLAEQFLDDLRLLLDGSQQAKWESAMRALRRTQMLGSVYSERSADLRAVIDGPPALLTGPDREACAGLLSEWELEMDGVLVRAARFIRSNMVANLQATRTNDGEARAKLFQQWRALVREERVLSGRYVSAMADVLAEGTALVLRRKVSEVSYPWLYEDRPATEPVRKALAMPELDGDVKKKLGALLTETEREHLSYADEAARWFEQWETTATPEQLRDAGSNPDVPAGLAERYTRLQVKVFERLGELLTTEQLRETGARRHVRSLPTLEFD